MQLGQFLRSDVAAWMAAYRECFPPPGAPATAWSSLYGATACAWRLLKERDDQLVASVMEPYVKKHPLHLALLNLPARLHELACVEQIHGGHVNLSLQSDEVVRAASSVLPTLPLVTSMALHIGVESTPHCVGRLVCSFKLRALQLSGFISNDMLQCMWGCVTLENVRLYGCKQVTDKGMLGILRHLTALKSLEMSGCELLTDDGFADGTKLKSISLFRATRVRGISMARLCSLNALALHSACDTFDNTFKFDTMAAFARLKYLHVDLIILRVRPPSDLRHLLPLLLSLTRRRNSC
jgi:hypothetical protein